MSWQGHLCFFMVVYMFSSSFRCLLLIVLFCLCYCCHRGDDYEQAGSLLKGLKDNQAHVTFKLADKDFYPGLSIFLGEVHADRNALSISVSSREGARSIVNFGGADWFRKRPMKTTIFEKGEVVASVKLGKITDQEKMIGE